jgi:DNA repair photolyase
MGKINKDSPYRSFLTTVGGNEGNKCYYPTRLDTYGRGCQHDCSYCYAKSLLEFRKLWDPVKPAVVDIIDVEKVIKKLKSGSIIRLGGMTDCFMPYELEKRVTYETIKLLNKYKIGYLIVTKSHLVALDEYISIMDKGLAHIQVTITTTNDDLSLTYEKASIPSLRILAVEKLQSLGFDVQIRLSPYIEGFIDLEKLNKIKCDKLLIEFLRVNHWIKKWFDIDYSEYTLPQNGYYHLELSKKIEMLSRITGFREITVCEDVDEHYKYWKENYNKNSNDCCNLTVFVND